MIPVPVIPERRRRLTVKQRADMHDRHGSKCVVCLEPIPAGEPFIDEHVIPLELGGSNDKSNRGPAHIACAKTKTKLDQKMIAKAARCRARHLGIKRKARGQPLPGTKRSGWKHKVNGDWVRR